MHFSDVLASVATSDGVSKVTVPDEWMQGRSAFGGLQAAIAARAMRTLVGADLPHRVVQIAFVAPVGAGPMAVVSRVLRTGKNVTHAEARCVIGGATASVTIGVFGRGRPSRVRVVPEPSPVDASAPVE